jgi:sugar transferase (PEP-CTERM/EpsH1 system associated)
MEGLLFLAHRIPFPPNKGDKIRSFHLLRHLSAHYAVHLGAFVDDPDDWRHRDALEPYCASLRLLPLNPRRARLASLRGLLTGEALTLPYYRSRELARWAAGLAASGTVTRGLAFSSAMAQFMPAGLSRRVLDMVDVDSDKWAQYAPTQRWPLSWVYAREGRKLAGWEARVAQDFDATLLVSRDEAALLQRRVPQARARIGTLENGVDAEYFSPRASCSPARWTTGRTWMRCAGSPSASSRPCARPCRRRSSPSSAAVRPKRCARWRSSPA